MATGVQLICLSSETYGQFSIIFIEATMVVIRLHSLTVLESSGKCRSSAWNRLV
jgi:hypothetical protein